MPDMTDQPTPQLRIEQHGLIGNLATAALVATDATIDYLCWPELDSPTVFASLLDAEHGGLFALAPCLEDAVTRQSYWPDSNVLSTRWMAPSGSAARCTISTAAYPARGRGTSLPFPTVWGRLPGRHE